MSRDQYDSKPAPPMDDDADELLTKLANLIYAGNRLARGDATAAEWHEAVRKATPAPICVFRSEGREGEIP